LCFLLGYKFQGIRYHFVIPHTAYVVIGGSRPKSTEISWPKAGIPLAARCRDAWSRAKGAPPGRRSADAIQAAVRIAAAVHAAAVMLKNEAEVALAA
jgi:hypothetical protein